MRQTMLLFEICGLIFLVFNFNIVVDAREIRFQEEKQYDTSFVNTHRSDARLLSSLPYKPVGIANNGGPVIGGGLNVYLIWYGNWSLIQKGVIRRFINSIGSSNPKVNGSLSQWWSVTTEYFDSAGKRLSAKVSLKGEFTDNYSLGKQGLQSVDFKDNFSSMLLKGKLPKDVNGIFLYLASSDVNITEPGYCSDFCSFFDSASLATARSTFYSFSVIGNPSRQCPLLCGTGQNPNGDYGVDATVNQIAFQLPAIATNPLGNGWFDSSKNTATQLCAFQFGHSQATGSGTQFNVVGVNSTKYFVQQVWDPRLGLCSLSTSPAPSKPYTPIGISYNGGPVMNKGVTIYIIWYGTWNRSDIATIVTFVQSMGSQNADVDGSVRRWWKILGLFYDYSGLFLSTEVHFGGQTFDKYSHGSQLSTLFRYGTGKLLPQPGSGEYDDISSIVKKTLSSKSLPYDPNGIYLVLTSADVTLPDFTASGYHFYTTVNQVNYQYSLVVGGGPQVEVISHELAETITDPTGQGWWNDHTTDEVADLCQDYSGRVMATVDGVLYNVVGANHSEYFVAAVFNPKLGVCAVQQPLTPTVAPFAPIGISYGLGPVMDKGVNIYLVWYGSWSASQKVRVRNFVGDLGVRNCTSANSVCKWWRINSLYYNADGQFLLPNVTLKGEYTIKNLFPSIFTNFGYDDLANAILSGQSFPKDKNGLFVILTAANVTQCSSVCSSTGVNEGFKWLATGNYAQHCPQNCTTGNSQGDLGVDSMLNYVAQAMSVAVTDPYLGYGWIGSYVHGVDLCTGEFGKTWGSFGKMYNLIGNGGRQYMVQQNWNPKTGTCVSQA